MSKFELVELEKTVYDSIVIFMNRLGVQSINDAIKFALVSGERELESVDSLYVFCEYLFENMSIALGEQENSYLDEFSGYEKLDLAERKKTAQDDVKTELLYYDSLYDRDRNIVNKILTGEPYHLDPEEFIQKARKI